MATLTVCDLDDKLEARLRQRAAQHGQSLEDEVRTILQRAVEQPARESGQQSTHYDAWFRQEVQQALSEADAAEAQWVSNESVKQQSALHRQRWQQRATPTGH